MKKRILILTVFAFYSFGMFSQSKLDSMLRKLPVMKEDTSKIKLLFAIEDEYLKTNPDSTLYYLNISDKLIKKLKASKYDYDYNFELVKVFHAKSDYNKALKYTLRSNQIAKNNRNMLQEAESYRTLFSLYQNLGKTDLAIKYALYSLKFSKSVGDTLNLSINYGNLSRLYFELNQFKKAIHYGEKGIESGKKYKNIKGLLICINNTALTYMNMNENAKAEKLFKSQLAIANKENFPRSSSKALINLCSIYIQTADKENLKKSIAELNIIASENNSVLSTADRTIIKKLNAHYHIFNNNFKQADVELNDGIQMAINDSLPSQLLNLYYLKTNLKYAEHKYYEAERYGSKYDSVNIIINDEEMSKFSLDLEEKYKVEKKDKEILLLEKNQIKQRTFIYSLAGIAMGLLIFSFLLYKNYRARKKINDQEIIQLHQEKKIDATQNMIQGEEQERTRLARDLHDGLGGILTGVKFQLNSMKGNVILSEENAGTFTKSISQIDNAIAEMRRVAHNMMPEALLKFGLDETLKSYCDSVSQNSELTVSYQSFGMEERLEQTNEIVLYRIVQELLNNTIKHAKATKSNIQLSRNGNIISLTVEDNGKGFDVNAIKKNGIGLSNINHRVEYLNGKMDIQSDSKGTSTHIEFEIT
ncbi:sensor histidine kinase [Flavobacterium sp.]|uniref:tetratricopeptide repeat-containing sensor histidine kinase n=1 Tax=Flavobacterium sp. TaxID=239 RepID=UPI00286D8E7B|nr:sensor histidine kinase [Flavobacterium sp.]